MKCESHAGNTGTNTKGIWIHYRISTKPTSNIFSVYVGAVFMLHIQRILFAGTRSLDQKLPNDQGRISFLFNLLRTFTDCPEWTRSKAMLDTTWAPACGCPLPTAHVHTCQSPRNPRVSLKQSTFRKLDTKLIFAARLRIKEQVKKGRQASLLKCQYFTQLKLGLTQSV